VTRCRPGAKKFVFCIDEAILAVAFILLTAAASAFAETNAPAVLPDRLEDVPPSATPADFYDFSWRSFIALNWPGKKGAVNRGLPDRTKPFSDTDTPRVWMTWKSRFEIFQPKAAKPKPWASYEGQNPCGADFRNDVLVTTHPSAAV
jgi:hypothetical protein